MKANPFEPSGLELSGVSKGPLASPYRLITEAISEFVWLSAVDGSSIYSNTRWLNYAGLTQEQSGSGGWERAVHPDDLAMLQIERERVLRTGETYEGECRFAGKDGKYRWFRYRLVPLRDESGAISSWLGTAADIDKQKRAETQHAFLALASDVLGSSLDVATTLERIAGLAIASVGTWCQIDIPDANGQLRVAVVAHQDPVKEELLQGLTGHHIYNDAATLGPPGVFTSIKPQLLAQVDESAVQYVIPQEKYRRIYRQVGYAAGLIVPLRIRNRVLGVLGIASDDPTRLYNEFDLATALELGRRGAIALENAQSFAREHRLATTLQRALLPSSLPKHPLVQFDSAYASAMSAQSEAVGGDWYDAFMLGDDTIAISMGDVAGHGLEAALTMGTVRQALRAYGLSLRSTRGALAGANTMLELEGHSLMTTALFGIFDPRTHKFAYAIAGHPRPLLVDASGEVRELAGAGTPLGVAFEISLLEEREVEIPPGSTLVFYTDGLIEYARDPLGSLARLIDIVAGGSFLRSEHPAQAIIDAVLDGRQHDDVAVLTMQLR